MKCEGDGKDGVGYEGSIVTRGWADMGDELR